ncbi:ankyrin repeat domain-containing protein [Catellatospora aurea]|uniref:Ankyrin repeat domain-containing protein n=1 Tax=Catellatospora aurea TaxID=1337874 RepID=A0ABW2GSX3_9ACTN
MITLLRGDLTQWRRIRTRMPTSQAVAAAADARAAGDWRTAAALADTVVDVDLDDVRDRFGTEAAAAIAEDLRHLALDLLLWHLPRHHGGMTTLRARTSAVLAPQAVDHGTPLLRVRLPLSPTGPQRLRLTVATLADLNDHRWYVAPRHTWDIRETAAIRAAWCCSADRSPLLAPDGTPLPWSALGTGDDAAAATERVYLLLAAGEHTAAWRACGIELPFTDTKALHRDPATPTCPVGLAAEIRAAAATFTERPRFPAERVDTLFGAHLNISVGDGLVAAESDPHDYNEGPPQVASGPIPADLALLHAGLSTPDDLHPLLRSALFPTLPPARHRGDHRSATDLRSPTTGVVGPPGRELPAESAVGEPGAPVRVRCRGEWHIVGVRDGALRLHNHDANELRREQALRVMGGASAGCFAVRDTWLTGAGRLPKALAAQRTRVRERLLDGDTDWLLDGLARGVVDPLMRDGSGWSLRHMAMWVDHPRLLPLLDAAGLPVDARDRIGRTPLYVAVMNGGDIALIRALLDAGADPYAETVHGASAIRVAGDHARRDDRASLDRLWRDRRTAADR